MGKLIAILLVVIGVSLLGCSSGPTDEEITESADAQTETVEAMPTDTPMPTDTYAPTPSDTPVPTDTPIPTNTPTPISEPSPETTPEFEVMFDGKDCTVDGPAELPAGKHSFIFINTSDLMGEVSLIYLRKDKTFQDNLDLQNEPGDWFPKQEWAYPDYRYSSEQLESNGRTVTLSTWGLSLVGEHTILCYVGPRDQKLWFAAPLMIIEPPSE